ncbi:MAG: nucleotide exchange factor GrpE [Nitriliruptorales bacterium]|nr:nucleotide exchange factor GrpE [Nitriliruptorales bacterium]
MSDARTDFRQDAGEQARPAPAPDPGAGAAPQAGSADHGDSAPGQTEESREPSTDQEAGEQEASLDRAAPPEEPVDERTPEELRSALAEAERLRDDYLDQAQRGRAEYQNLKRRADESLAAALDRGGERLLNQLLGVLDNFGYVVDAISEGDDAQLAKGVQMVHGELVSALEAAGLEPIPGVGAAFNPEMHEALLSEESPEPLDEPVVTEVLRPGYRFKGRTLRPASVKVFR